MAKKIYLPELPKNWDIETNIWELMFSEFYNKKPFLITKSSFVQYIGQANIPKMKKHECHKR